MTPTETDAGRSPLECRDTGAVWLDLLATVGGAYGPRPIERLGSPQDLAEWLATAGLSPATAPTEDDLARAHRLRDLLRPLGLAAAAGRPAPRDAVDDLNDLLDGAWFPRLTATDAGGLAPTAPPDTAAALTCVARRAAEQLSGPASATLRTCADEECGRLFLDPSGRRRWCQANVCGVRHRVRAYRRRCSTADGSPEADPTEAGAGHDAGA